MARRYWARARHLDAEQPLHRDGVPLVGEHGRHVVDAVGERHEAVPAGGLADLLDGAVEVADVRHRLAEHLAVGLDDEVDDAVGGGVLGPEVEDHLLVVAVHAAEDELFHGSSGQALGAAGGRRGGRGGRRGGGGAGGAFLAASARASSSSRRSSTSGFSRTLSMPCQPPALLVVLAERVADPVVGQHDAPQVGVAGEVHAEEVVDLPLEPVGGLPDRVERRHHRVGAGRLDLELERVLVPVGEEVDHHLDDLPLGPVHRGEVLAEVEVELRRLLEEAADLDEPRRPSPCSQASPLPSDGPETASGKRVLSRSWISLVVISIPLATGASYSLVASARPFPRPGLGRDENLVATARYRVPDSTTTGPRRLSAHRSFSRAAGAG